MAYSENPLMLFCLLYLQLMNYKSSLCQLTFCIKMKFTFAFPLSSESEDLTFGGNIFFLEFLQHLEIVFEIRVSKFGDHHLQNLLAFGK